MARHLLSNIKFQIGHGVNSIRIHSSTTLDFPEMTPVLPKNPMQTLCYSKCSSFRFWGKIHMFTNEPMGQIPTSWALVMLGYAKMVFFALKIFQVCSGSSRFPSPHSLESLFMACFLRTLPTPRPKRTQPFQQSCQPQTWSLKLSHKAKEANKLHDFSSQNKTMVHFFWYTLGVN